MSNYINKPAEHLSGNPNKVTSKGEREDQDSAPRDDQRDPFSAPSDQEKVDAIEKNIDLMLQWIRRGIARARATGRLQAGSRDVLDSAVASFLRETSRPDYREDFPYEEVWEALRRMLNKKIDTWKRRPWNQRELLNTRSADIADPEAADAWLGRIAECSLNAGDVEHWIRKLSDLIEGLEDDELRYFAELRMQTYTFDEIVKLTGWSLTKVRRLSTRLKRWLRDQGLGE